MITESIDSYIEIEAEQDYIQSQLRQIVDDVMDKEQMATKEWKSMALCPKICSGRLLDIRKNGKDMLGGV